MLKKYGQNWFTVIGILISALYFVMKWIFGVEINAVLGCVWLGVGLVLMVIGLVLMIKALRKK